MKYKCQVCGYIYDEDEIDPETGDKNLNWDELPDDWTCPKCGAPKSDFKKVVEPDNEDLLDENLDDDFDLDNFDDFDNEEENY